MDNNELLSNFGKLLISSVRDEVLEIDDLILSGRMGGSEIQEFYDRAKNLTKDEKELIKKFALQAVDSTLHHFLWMIEQNEEYDLIKYTGGKGEFVSLRDISDGLCGELYTEDGWIEKYSEYPASIK